MIVTLTGMSTSGKSTLAKLLSSTACFEETVSITTRNKRAGEVDGIDYHFVDDKTFDNYVENNLLVEHVRTHGASYGTLSSELERIKDKGKSPVMVLDPYGAESVHNYMKDADDSVMSVLTQVDFPILMARFFRRIEEQRNELSDTNIDKEVGRLHTMLSEEIHWEEMWPWDLMLINIHNEQKMHKTLGMFQQMHNENHSIPWFDKKLSEKPSSKGVDREALKSIIIRQLEKPKEIRAIIPDIRKAASIRDKAREDSFCLSL